MSALEQIRQRPILIISILGLALLLFILTAVDNPGELFSDNHTVAKVDGQKIDYMEFQRRVEQQSEQMRAQGYTDIDNARLQQQVLQSMINEVLLNEEYKALGLTVTDNELSNAMLGETPNPIVTQMVQQMGLPSAKEFYDYAFNPTKYGMEPAQAQQLQQAWQSLEKDTEQMLMQQKFATLFQGVIQANKLDAKAYYDDNAETRTIAYVRKDLSTLDDKDFTPSEKEIDAVYKEQKERFKIPLRRRPRSSPCRSRQSHRSPPHYPRHRSRSQQRRLLCRPCQHHPLASGSPASQQPRKDRRRYRLHRFVDV